MRTPAWPRLQSAWFCARLARGWKASGCEAAGFRPGPGSIPRLVPGLSTRASGLWHAPRPVLSGVGRAHTHGPPLAEARRPPDHSALTRDAPSDLPVLRDCPAGRLQSWVSGEGGLGCLPSVLPDPVGRPPAAPRSTPEGCSETWTPASCSTMPVAAPAPPAPPTGAAWFSPKPPRAAPAARRSCLLSGTTDSSPAFRPAGVTCADSSTLSPGRTSALSESPTSCRCPEALRGAEADVAPSPPPLEAESSASAPVPNRISETRVWGEVEQNSSIALPGTGGHSGLLPLETVCPYLGGRVRSFIAMVQEWGCR